MKQANVRFTYDDYLLLPEDKRYEIVEGELLRGPGALPASPAHPQRPGRGTLDLCQAPGHRRGLFAPCDVVLSMENVVQPDLMFVADEHKSILTAANVQGPPDLVVEILSRSTKQRDLEIKRKLYARYGVREYWIVDPDAATVEVLVWSESGYASAGVCSVTDRLSSPLLPELNLPLSEIFKKDGRGNADERGFRSAFIRIFPRLKGVASDSAYLECAFSQPSRSARELNSSSASPSASMRRSVSMRTASSCAAVRDPNRRLSSLKTSSVSPCCRPCRRPSWRPS